MSKIITRSGWGAKPWSGKPATVALSKRTEFFVHYHGDEPPHSTGTAVPKEVEKIHRNNGWSGTGYSFMVDQDGAIYEGRGWMLQGAHCPGHNISGLSVYVAVGGDQEPTDKALASVRWLYDQACKKTGRTLAKKGHKDGLATACPGKRLYAWVQAGMLADGYEETPAPSGGGSSSGGSSVARYRVIINGLTYGHGAEGAHITKVGQTLVKKGFGSHYKVGPGPKWTDADTRNYAAFQRSRGYTGKDADGIPGASTLKELLGTLPGAAKDKPKPKPQPPFPGRDKFGPGRSNGHITTLGQQLVRRGYGRHYTKGPGPKWSDVDRKAVEAFQRAQGWTGKDADGLPGPQTWKLLFS